MSDARFVLLGVGHIVHQSLHVDYRTIHKIHDVIYLILMESSIKHLKE